MKFITLLTDFGLQDGYPGVMKGVIYNILPDARVIDITHQVHPQNILEGSLVWDRSYLFFPEGTVHVAVVDPGVGTHRRPLAARLGQYFFVCPDNGLITPMLETAEQNHADIEIVHLDQPRFWLREVSNVFHGRDIFAPVAAHLASGIAPREMGTLIQDPVRLHLPVPQKTARGWRGEVIGIDHFGNLSTNLTRAQVQGIQNPRIRVAGREIRGLARTFGDGAPGTLLALIDSDDHMAVAVSNGSAARDLNAAPGDLVEIEGAE